ncbi:hypothetical protein KI387_018550, partial [Taxus chinensis]
MTNPFEVLNEQNKAEEKKENSQNSDLTSEEDSGPLDKKVNQESKKKHNLQLDKLDILEEPKDTIADQQTQTGYPNQLGRQTIWGQAPTQYPALTMRMLSWNAGGLCAPKKHLFLKNHIKPKEIDIPLQEMSRIGLAKTTFNTRAWGTQNLVQCSFNKLQIHWDRS